MSSFKALIIDDSPQARKLMRLMLEEYPKDITVIGEAEQAKEGLLLIKQLKPDVVFLDIEMPGKSGIQLAEHLVSENINTPIIFTTAYDEYALKAFRLSAIDYLLKPINETHLDEAINKLKKNQKKEEPEKLKVFIENYEDKLPKTLNVPTSSGSLFLKTDDILYIKADGSYTHIHLSNGKINTVSKNLKYFENALSGSSEFVRVHRSFLINMHQMKKFDKQNRGEITMNDNVKIDLARDRRDDFFNAIENYTI